MAVEPRLMTAEDLLQPDVPEHAELVRGVLVVREPPGFRHGEITVRLASALMIHVDAHNLGRVVGGDAGFQLQSDPEVWTAGAVSRGRHGQWEWNVEVPFLQAVKMGDRQGYACCPELAGLPSTRLTKAAVAFGRHRCQRSRSRRADQRGTRRPAAALASRERQGRARSGPPSVCAARLAIRPRAQPPRS